MESIAAEEKLIGESTSKFLNIWDSAATESHCVTGTLCFIVFWLILDFLFFFSELNCWSCLASLGIGCPFDKVVAFTES